MASSASGMHCVVFDISVLTLEDHNCFFPAIIYLFPSALVSDIWAMYLDRIQNTGWKKKQACSQSDRNQATVGNFNVGRIRYLALGNQDLWDLEQRQQGVRAQLLESGEG